MAWRVPSSDKSATAAPSSRGGTQSGAERLVTAAFDDSCSTLDAEVALIDRLFGGEIFALFERKA